MPAVQTSRYEYCMVVPSETTGYVVRGEQGQVEVAYDRDLVSVLNVLGSEGWRPFAWMPGGFVMGRERTNGDAAHQE